MTNTTEHTTTATRRAHATEAPGRITRPPHADATPTRPAHTPAGRWTEAFGRFMARGVEVTGATLDDWRHADQD